MANYNTYMIIVSASESAKKSQDAAASFRQRHVPMSAKAPCSRSLLIYRINIFTYDSAVVRSSLAAPDQSTQSMQQKRLQVPTLTNSHPIFSGVAQKSGLARPDRADRTGGGHAVLPDSGLRRLQSEHPAVRSRPGSAVHRLQSFSASHGH